MWFNNANCFKPFLSPSSLTETFVRCGHMRCTKLKCHRSPSKQYGVKRVGGQFVTSGTMVIKQRTLKFHPGLNVGLSRNGSLFAMCNGIVHYTCEVFDGNFEHDWVKRSYEGREAQKIYKKYVNIIQEPQHFRFKLIDAI